MAGNTNNYNLLIQKLDQFIRKYYLNQLLRGLIYTGVFLLGFFLMGILLEYFLFLPSITRKVLFYGYIVGGVLVVGRWVALPILRYNRLGDVISYEQAANIIGKHFSNVQDKLLNILQLKGQASGMSDASLIEASIDQKINNLSPVPFSAAVNLKENKKYLPYLAPFVLLFLVLLLASPDVITDGTTRLINNSKDYAQPAPFVFNVDNEELKAVQFDDYTLAVSVEGEVLPEQVFVKQGGYSYRMDKKSKSKYEYTFSNLQKDLDFKLNASGFDSKGYQLEVLPKPMIIGFEVWLDYPAYTGKEDELLKNIGDLNVPVGTKVKWKFNARNTETVQMQLGDSTSLAVRRGEEQFDHTETIMKSTGYKLKVSNKELKNADSIAYVISVVPDQYPSITVQPMEDSASMQYLYFLGEVTDDYGLRGLYLRYKIDKEDGTRTNKYESLPVDYKRASKIYSQFDHYWNLNELAMKPGDKMTYYFEIYDNDAVNGSKSTRSTTMTYELPSMDEIDDQTAKSNEELKEQLAESIDKADELRKELKDIKDKIIAKKDLNWEDKKAIENLLSEQKNLENTVKDMQKEMGANFEKQKQFKELDPEIAKKQEQLQKLFDEVLNDDMKKLFEEMEALLQDMDKEELLDELEDFEFSEEQLEDELDRMLALFKQLEFEQKLTETIDKLEELAKEQEELAGQTENKEKDNESLAEEQEKLNEEFDKLKEDMEELEEINKEMDQQYSFEEQKQDASEVSDEMQESSESLDSGKNKKASDSQKSAAQKMKEMSKDMAAMQQQMQMEQMEMDMAAIRQLLENLVKLSFDQEQLMDDIQLTNINDPKYAAMIQEQYKLKDDAKMVEDSLYALSKRVAEIQSFVTKEIKDINKNVAKSIDELEARRKPQANTHQQYTMTGFNNLALMLDEVMQQMQQQMASQMPGNQACQKPGSGKGSGKGKPSPGLGQLQDKLNQQLKDMKQMMKDGKMPGGRNGMSKGFAQMAAKQAALRKAIQELNDMENSDGENALGDLEELMKQMDKTETDLVNKVLTEETLMRQQEILTRLLQTEEAMRERELDNKRKSESADEIAKNIPPSLEDYIKKREAEVQLYKTVPPTLKPYYKYLVESYFKNISF